jgi:hypothetical protein
VVEKSYNQTFTGQNENAKSNTKLCMTFLLDFCGESPNTILIFIRLYQTLATGPIRCARTFFSAQMPCKLIYDNHLATFLVSSALLLCVFLLSIATGICEGGLSSAVALMAGAPGMIDISPLSSPLKRRRSRGYYSSGGTSRDDKAISIRDEGNAKRWLALTNHQLLIANAAHHDDADEELAVHVRF